ncbi:integrase-like protein [Murinocardiopsis flavida]|uniref:Integrase-like protein n=1 Tax=Murinocardiopsis flavida TaxID=645275 RepID=A0A2P8CBF4_9ACTN|nr:integrase-like protein [Murinocardiopsis flavida]
MGYAKKRTAKNGTTRYTAVYIDIRGQERSAGTFDTAKAADKAWQRAEVKVSEGRITSIRHGRQRFDAYTTETWLPNHVVEHTTRQNITYCVRRHLLPEFGRMRMNEILPAHVQEFVRKSQERGFSPSSIHWMVTVLSAIFSNALLNQVVFLHPCKGVVMPKVGRKPLEMITPEQFDAFHSHITGEEFQLLVELTIESGLRWGEVTELRPKDIDRSTGITDDDLLFGFPEPESAPPIPELPAGVDLGRTAPDAKGRTYKHGTMTAHQRQMSLRPLPHRPGALPRPAPGRWKGPAPPAAHQHHRRPPARGVVPHPHLAPRPRKGRAAEGHHPAQTPPRPRLMAPGRRSRPGRRQGTPRPRLHHHHRALPPHPPRRRRQRLGSPRQHPRPRTRETRQHKRNRVTVHRESSWPDDMVVGPLLDAPESTRTVRRSAIGTTGGGLGRACRAPQSHQRSVLVSASSQATR